jgi:hypothetical protein
MVEAVREGWPAHPHYSLAVVHRREASDDVARSDAGSTTGPRKSVIYLDNSVVLAHRLSRCAFGSSVRNFILVANGTSDCRPWAIMRRYTRQRNMPHAHKYRNR